jgi:hypothetical protein
MHGYEVGDIEVGGLEKRIMGGPKMRRMLIRRAVD